MRVGPGGAGLGPERVARGGGACAHVGLVEHVEGVPKRAASSVAATPPTVSTPSSSRCAEAGQTRASSASASVGTRNHAGAMTSVATMGTSRNAERWIAARRANPDWFLKPACKGVRRRGPGRPDHAIGAPERRPIA
ncbi:hypothetical protein GCM10025877_28190 [Agromyces mangrovi Wang et al. 2018]|nr:hypothetical protein GCM10025877_28190 [Agromyces mangrovi]